MGNRKERKVQPRIDIDQVRMIVKEFERSDALELELDNLNTGFHIRVKRSSAPTTQQAAPTSTPEKPENPLAEFLKDPERYRIIVAPLTGTYFARPKPDADPYVKIGTPVDEKTVVCMIETMKTFNEVTADHKGVVAYIHAENGKLVYAKDISRGIEATPIMVIDTKPPEQAQQFSPYRR